MSAQGPTVFVLTSLTRDAAAQRTVVLSGIELPRRNVIIVLLAAIPGLFLGLFLWPTFGKTTAMVAFFAIQGAAYWLIERRSKQGMKLRMWQHLLDSSKKVDGKVFICGEPVDVLTAPLGTIRRNTVPQVKTAADEVRQLDQLVTGGSLPDPAGEPERKRRWWRRR